MKNLPYDEGAPRPAAGARRPVPPPDAPLTPEELREIREKIEQGFYDQDLVARITAERILDTADLPSPQ